MGVLVAVGLVAACGSGGGSDGKKAAGGTFVVSLLSDPRSLDPSTSNHIVALQVTYQIFETLVKLEPGGTAIVPGLARSWSSSEAGRVWSFELEHGVRFHDGAPFDAAAVCANFERWYHFSGVLQAPFVSGVWQGVFGGFATRDLPTTPPESLYQSCAAPAGDQAVITLSRPSGAFLSALASPPFSIASPDALKRYEADKVSGAADAPRFEGTFGTEHPIGTGPFKLERWTPKDRLVLLRNDDYWGTKAHLDRIIFRYVPDGAARRQALETGEIEGYDPVDPPDIDPLRRAGFQVVERPAFNVGSLGINQA
ncbi:MAG: ABC transporter substrate-binding protein, partial [Acidimicrobiales bacterium]